VLCSIWLFVPVHAPEELPEPNAAGRSRPLRLDLRDQTTEVLVPRPQPARKELLQPLALGIARPLADDLARLACLGPLHLVEPRVLGEHHRRRFGIHACPVSDRHVLEPRVARSAEAANVFRDRRASASTSLSTPSAEMLGPRQGTTLPSTNSASTRVASICRAYR
jgi:hypothetical protein